MNILKNIKSILILIVIIVLIAAAAFGIMKHKGIDLLGVFKSEPLKIDKTANVVTEIRKISEFTSACYYEEIVLVKKKTEDNKVLSSISPRLSKLPIAQSKSELVIIAKGKVRAGFDLSGLTENDIRIKSDTLVITLPKVTIFDVILNPSGFEVFIEEGTWTQREVRAIQNGAKDKIKNNALADGILNKANDYGQEKLINIFKALGFNEVIIRETASK